MPNGSAALVQSCKSTLRNSGLTARRTYPRITKKGGGLMKIVAVCLAMSSVVGRQNPVNMAMTKNEETPASLSDRYELREVRKRNFPTDSDD